MNLSVPRAYHGTSPADRFERFFHAFTAPVLPFVHRQETVSIFRGLTHKCLADYRAVERWDSRLTTDGTPMELSLVVSTNGHIDVRFLVDPQLGPQAPAYADAMRHTCARLVIPECERHAGVVDRLLEQHLADVPDGAASYTAFGIRVSPQSPRAGRLYFPNWWRSADTGRDLVSQWLYKDDAERLWASPLGRRAMAGVGYDFSSRGHGRTKVYGWTDGVPKADCLALAKAFLPDKAEAVGEVLDAVSAAKHPLWVLPTTLLAVGLRPTGGLSDLAFCLPAFSWEWRTFRDLWPALASMLRRIGIPFTDPGDEPAETSCPPWRFVPTWLALTASSHDMSVSVYFKPLKDARVSHPTSSALSIPDPPDQDSYPRSGDKSDCQKALNAMFRVLASTETY